MAVGCSLHTELGELLLDRLLSALCSDPWMCRRSICGCLSVGPEIPDEEASVAPEAIMGPPCQWVGISPCIPPMMPCVCSFDRASTVALVGGVKAHDTCGVLYPMRDEPLCHVA
jgi:hypothetical protein